LPFAALISRQDVLSSNNDAVAFAVAMLANGGLVAATALTATLDAQAALKTRQNHPNNGDVTEVAVALARNASSWLTSAPATEYLALKLAATSFAHVVLFGAPVYSSFLVALVAVGNGLRAADSAAFHVS
jgi:hypothetical protein